MRYSAILAALIAGSVVAAAPVYAVTPPGAVGSIVDASIVEGNEPARIMTFTITVTPPSASDFTLRVATNNGTADSDDYQPRARTLTIAHGVTHAKYKVKVYGDTDVEPDETLTVKLSRAVGATIRRGTGHGTILDDDIAAPTTPVIDGFDPFSPGLLTTFSVMGTATSGSDVSVYVGSDCSGPPEATGSAADFASPGIPVTVGGVGSYEIHADASNAGGTSACSAASTYEVTDMPAAPSINRTSPDQFADKINTNPAVFGEAPAGSTVDLYFGDSCAGSPIATGTAAEFGNAGITVTVPAYAISVVTATATFGANTSPCSNAYEYLEDTPIPETEPNDSNAQANALPSLDGLVPGSFTALGLGSGSSSDVDVYQFSVPEATTVYFQLADSDYGCDAGIAAVFPITLELSDGSSTVGSATTTPVSDCLQTSVDVPAGGTYYLKVAVGSPLAVDYIAGMWFST